VVEGLSGVGDAGELAGTIKRLVGVLVRGEERACAGGEFVAAASLGGVVPARADDEESDPDDVGAGGRVEYR
jgi:hypothetical protein